MQDDNPKVVTLDNFRRVASPLMLAEPSGLLPEMKVAMYRQMSRALMGMWYPQWKEIAFQMGMQAYRPEFEMEAITFDAFGGDDKDTPKLLLKDPFSERISIVPGYQPFIRQTISLMCNGQIMVRDPFIQKPDLLSGEDTRLAAIIRHHHIPNGIGVDRRGGPTVG